jgi:hypothetical protein
MQYKEVNVNGLLCVDQDKCNARRLTRAIGPGVVGAALN